MDEKNIHPESAAQLRQRAEVLFLERAPQAPAMPPPEEARRMLHELQVHQIELEMQNEEMHRLREEMDASRARYFELYDLAPVGYLTVTEPGLIREANFTAAGLLGVSRGALVKRPFTRFILPADLDIYYLQLRKILKMGLPQAFELRMLGRNSQPFWWAHLAATNGYAADDTPELRIVLSDITGLKESEAALARSEERFRTLTENVPSLVYVTDAKGECIYVNRRWREAAGMTSEEAYGNGWLNAVHEDDREKIAEQWQRSVQSEGLWGFEYRFKNREGKVTWVYGTAEKIMAADGSVVGFAGTNIDITEQKRGQQMLAWEKNALELISGVAPMHEVLNSLMLGLEKQLPGALCSVLLLDDDDGIHLRTGAAPSLPEAYIHAIDGLAIGPAVGSCGTAAYDQRQVIVTDIESDPLWAGYCELARAHGLLACWSTPVNGNDGKILGVFVISYRERHQPDSAELEQLALAVHVISIAIERKRAEEELLYREKLLRAITDGSEDMIFIKDRDSRLLFLNPAGCRLFGLTTDQVVGRTDAELQPDPDFPQAARFVAMDRRVMESRQPTTFEEEFFTPDGERHILLTSKTPRFDDQGNVSGIVGISRDITERKRAEESLREANQKLRLHFEQTPMAVIEWDLDFRVTQWNPSACTIFGYRREEALGQHASFIVPEAFRSQVDGVMLALIKKTGGERSSNPNVSKNGAAILCEWYNTPLINEQGIVTGIASVVMNITERMQAQQLLAWEKSALESINRAESLGKVLAKLMLGLEAQLPGALCSVLLLDDDGIHLRPGAAPSLPDAYTRALDGIAIGPTGGSCGTAAYVKRQVIVADIESDLRWADCRELALEHGLRACWSTPIHGGAERVLGAFAIYYREPRHPVPAELELIERAVHVIRLAIERKQAEEQILQFSTSLERRVEQRTAELQAANKELEAFSYSVSHDLRAPLRAVDGYSRMVIEDCSAQLDADGRRMLGVIREETQRMGRLIDDLLAFSRLGRQQVEPLAINMHELAQEVFDELAAHEPERQLRLVLHPIPPAGGTQAMIRQVWVNLISNAIKFTQGREVGEIEIGTLDGEDGVSVYFIKDNGAGFDMRHAGKLFGVFQRLHGAGEFAGTGVGLALVQRIVQRHGGRIWAEGEIGRGATFSFTIQTPEL